MEVVEQGLEWKGTIVGGEAADRAEVEADLRDLRMPKDVKPSKQGVEREHLAEKVGEHSEQNQFVAG